MLIRVRPSWQLREQDVTCERVFLNRRQFLRGITAAGFGLATTPVLHGCQSPTQRQLEQTLATPPLSNVVVNPAFRDPGRPITHRLLAGQYNNFYEFGSGKDVWPRAQKLPSRPWQIEVSGLVKRAQTFTIEDLLKRFPLEERIYRFRCVEAWSMVIPWIGFPMHRLIATVEPTTQARFVRFVSYYNPSVTTGTPLVAPFLPWPYSEGLRLAEMANELAFFAVGAYGRSLSKQQGAPLRCVLPWMYGFKGAKSIVRIEFVDQQPATFWNTLLPKEYGFKAVVDPSEPHPRWSQAKERWIGDTDTFQWKEIPTLPYNGYGEWVTALYPHRS
jgi:methionine sulfoxide reductase catalytic subunit